MKSIKRAPLWGQIGIMILILITVIGISIQYTQLKEINNSLNATINEQIKTIENLENEKDNLTNKISQLEEEIKNQKKEKVYKTVSTPQTTITQTSSNGNGSLGTFKISAYCHCAKCCGKSDGITASGVKAVEGVTVAADTSKLPLGTKVYIEGVGERIVQDRGGSIKGNKIDLYFSSHSAALNWGIQYKDVSLVG